MVASSPPKSLGISCTSPCNIFTGFVKRLFVLGRQRFVVCRCFRNRAGNRIKHGFEQTANGAQLARWKFVYSS